MGFTQAIWITVRALNISSRRSYRLPSEHQIFHVLLAHHLVQLRRTLQGSRGFYDRPHPIPPLMSNAPSKSPKSNNTHTLQMSDQLYEGGFQLNQIRSCAYKTLNGLVCCLYQHTFDYIFAISFNACNLSFLFGSRIIKMNGKEEKKQGKQKYKLIEAEQVSRDRRMALLQRHATAV